MASSASISGLSSGLDTASLVSQFMQLEAVPQTRLKARVTTEQKVVTALQTLNTKAALVGSKAASLAKPATWDAVTASVSTTGTTPSGVSVSADSTTAGPGRFSVTVTAVAQTHQLGFTSAAALTDTVTGGSTKVTIDRFDGTPVQIDTGDGTLKGLVAAINDSANNTGLRATPVKSADGYRLIVESVATGAASDFTITAEDGSALLGGATVRAGADARIDLGSGIVATSTTNTFADLTPGVTVTLSDDAVVGSTSTVTVKQDVSKISAAIADLVASANSLISEIDTQTANSATAGASGVLAGDAMSRNLRTSVLSTLFSAVGSTTLAKVGIQSDRTGKITFDTNAFATAYAKDPAGTEALFTAGATAEQNGFAARLEKVAKAASDSTTGTITTSIASRRSGVDRLQDSIDAWDVRLAQRKETLERQFTALETALNQMNQQSSWLSGQISSLPSYS
ncbi:flagellar filament capping protein FliD [Nocardioides flavescens]|uniref:Flagellar hook-associated protein 2 n=1 Tax=Nocardioides flavescens TaxID=2691959 RepID=A0A6L7EMV9_9ACTN|nr:flagellar filament capping protein FliD [Nocardioides flavescens]MXG87940.1 flagellar filament capping protein FliD [Nocardioides flavescens]